MPSVKLNESESYLSILFIRFSLWYLKPYKLHKLEEGPSTRVTVSQEDAVRMLRQLLLIRRLETSAGNLYKEKVVRGFCHLSSGQEAIAVGIRCMMREQDSIISGYRSHGWAYLMGVSPANVLCELTGRRSGCSRGKGGSMHMYASNFYGGNGIVGAQSTILLIRKH
ncbi:hypothetical protein LSTR_LSTR016543 [Laodelphax striatellus]|uniref:Dehydrogenase E1 component domain-containing protein n=1 Tax=Laodelphax striatellus TaxID=195883 RepID=A0A482XR08_LAOST|nr:hypothetical protein LSTR_LSTR016543 [Laodelphax striatellus]